VATLAPSWRARVPIRVAVLAAFLAPAFSCADPCISWKARWVKTLEDARRSQAPLYAPATFTRALELASKAERECGLQRSRFFLSRSYKVAERLFASARQEGLDSVREGRMKQGIARQEALNARYSAGNAVNDARIALLRAEKFTGDPAAQALLERLDRLRQAFGKLQERIDRSDYLAAREMGLRIQEEAVRLEADADRRALASGGR
jgi:hypothetical protein